MDLWVLLTVAGVFLAIVLAVVVALWLSWTATRLDRMHHRIDVARETLRARLLHRSGVTLELAVTDALDPASRILLLDAAHRARNAGPEDIESAESSLSEALRAVLSDHDTERSLLEPEARAPHDQFDQGAGEQSDQGAGEQFDEGAEPLLAELARACAKVELARRFHNDVVVSARALRSRRRVRWLHLAGRAGPLRTVDLDDVPPSTLQAG